MTEPTRDETTETKLHGKAVVDRQDLAALLGTITPVVDAVPLTDDAIERLCTALKATINEGGE